ncbi:helix-turn-helix domain-containing protein, partial [Moraxella bovoculi]|uniref:helix-turn-helix domain-containing protein n=1 Tax=Moraxella bovoculi TaxID=386891 RepID=UPI00156D50BF|nr:helix-turn-helix domain-containing protein [Moraxella bovoculi]
MTNPRPSSDEREKIILMLAQGIKPSKIASMLGRSRSTISREISKNCKLNQACKPKFK